jgi:hypothetical protein
MDRHGTWSAIFNEFLRIFNVLASQATKWFGMALVDRLVDNVISDLTNEYNFPLTYYHLGVPLPFAVDLR